MPLPETPSRPRGYPRCGPRQSSRVFQLLWRAQKGFYLIYLKYECSVYLFLALRESTP